MEELKKEILKEFDEKFVCNDDPEEHPFVAFYDEEENRFDFWSDYTIKSFLSQSLTRIAEEARREAVEEKLNQLTPWIDDNIGVSSKAIFLWMSAGKIPSSMEAPSDASDRGRCVVLLKAVPEWIPRLSEIVSMDIECTVNGKPRKLWNEQIPLILQALQDNK